MSDPVQAGEVSQRLKDIHSRIETACNKAGREPGSVRLLAVTKTVAIDVLAAALEAGQHLLGENYVQEAVKKAAELSALNPAFHLIGHLQRNKVKQAVGLFELIHTVDRLELAAEISKVAAARGIEQRVLIQVNISAEESKSGIAAEAAAGLAAQIARLPAIKLCGLMCIGSYVEPDAPEQDRRREFIAMRNLRGEIEQTIGVTIPELSMGMSHDFEPAIEEGATIVRVGSAIFGERA